MTSTIDKLFNYVLKMRKYREEADNHPELEPELKIKFYQVMDELKSKKQEHSEAIEREILQRKAAGQDINPYDQNQEFSLLHFVMGGLLDTKLLQHFTITDIKDPNNLLARAICNDNIEAVKWLLDNGVSPNAQDKNGGTMLEFAISDDNSDEIAKLLIDRGADVNAQNKYGCTALHIAVLEHNIPIMKLLLEKGADVNIKREYDSAPLDHIFSRCYEDDQEIIRPDEIKLNALSLLLEYGAEVKSDKIWKAVIHNFQEETTKTKVLFMMLGSAKDIKIDLEFSGVLEFFTDENNIKALFAVDGYEEQKSIAKENLLKSLQDYGQTHHDQKVLDIIQHVSEQEVSIPDTQIVEDTTPDDQLDGKVELSGEAVTDIIEAA